MSEPSHSTAEVALEKANLTTSQLLIWMGQELNPDVPLYNMILSFHLLGPVDAHLFEQAFDQLTQDCESLRTIIETIEGIPYARVLDRPGAEFNVLDFSAEADPEDRLHHWIEARRGFVFDLSQCLFDSVLIKLASGHFVWYLNQHHLITDGMSVGLLYQRMSQLYELAKLQDTQVLPALPSFQEYVAHEKAQRRSKRAARSRRFWDQKLEKSLGPTRLYHSKALLDKGSRIERVTYDLGPELSEALQGIAGESTLGAMTLHLATFNILATLLLTYLFQISGRNRQSIGVPFHNRPTENFRETIGLFIEMCPVRIEIADQETFTTLLRKVAEESYQVLRHSQFGISNSSVRRAYDVILNYQTTSLADFAGLPVRSDWIHSGHWDSNDNFSLQVEDFDASGSLKLHFDFNCDVFAEHLRESAVQHFVQVLKAFVDNPDQSIYELELLTSAEKTRILVDFNETDSPYGKHLTLSDRFEAQAQRQPDADALVYKNRALSYGDMQAQVNQLAAHLQALGVGPNSLVGIFMERCPEMIIALFAVHRAGGAYVPLDPDYPAERLEFMLTDTAAGVILTQAHLQSRLPQHDAEVICLEPELSGIGAPAQDLAPARSAPDDLAYVIYTSGSTGKPKGVAMAHKSAGALVDWAEQVYALVELSGVLASTSINFDLSVFEIFVPLSLGGCIILVENALELPTLEAIDRVTLINTVPSAMAGLVQLGTLPASVRTVNLAGEPLKNALVQQIYATDSIEKVYNLYGPSEDTTYSTFVLCEKGMTAAPTIGTPISNTRAYLLDKHSQPVPVGVPAELYLGGEGLAKGYLNRPQLTAEKFVPDPFSIQAGARLYRTGDLARQRVDGSLEFLGRMDHQVKVRGYRIELGEIETALDRHPAVHEAVVLARTDLTPQRADELGPSPRLVAYVVPAPDRDLTDTQLSSHLGTRLPRYMIPAHFMFLEALPLTPNGKVDRQALPAPQRLAAEDQETFAPSRNPTERMLAEIWQNTLGREQIGIHDNFFDLGGDSIVSLQINARAHQQGLRLGFSDVFKYQTIAELASAAEHLAPVEAERGPVSGVVPLTPIQHWYFEQYGSKPYYWTQSFLLEIPESLNAANLEVAFNQLVAYHDSLRLRFHETPTGWEQLNVESAEAFKLGHLELTDLDEAEQQKALKTHMETMEASLDIRAGPLIAASHIVRGELRPNLLFITVHHLAVDAVSWSILLGDLESLYLQLDNRTATRDLPPKTTSYKHWSQKLAEYAQSRQVQAELDHWTRDAAQPGAHLPIEVDQVADRNTIATTLTQSTSLGEDLTQALLRDVPGVYNTQINDLLLAALAETLEGWTGQRRFVIDLEGHGREDVIEGADLSRTVGWFTSVYPVTLNLSTGQEAGKRIQSIKEQLRRTPRRGIGYGVLCYLNRESASQLAAQAPAEILFNYLGQLDSMLSGSELFKFAGTLVGSRSPAAQRRHLIEIAAYVLDGRLQIDWVYSHALHGSSTIQNLAADYLVRLTALINHCLSAGSGGFTPSDFPEADLDQDELDALLAEFGEG
jgi:amino acid adenylation domain-containing protein/non-ribosomal peptide synthase protein (TIGR01720 family)